jgi:hypothetical protein
MQLGFFHNQLLTRANRDAEKEGAAAASAAALASPCKASMGALRLERGEIFFRFVLRGVGGAGDDPIGSILMGLRYM